MRKVVAAMNLTIDGFCDHTAGIADEELHDHYTGLLNDGSVILYGRIAYELMQFWQTLLKEPSDEKSMNDFAAAIDRIPKIVFSHTLKTTGWDSAALSDKTPGETILELKQDVNASGDILIGSPGLIVQLANLDLIDEYQLGIHPVVIGKGLQLFEGIKDRKVFKLLKTKSFNSGVVIHYYGRS